MLAVIAFHLKIGLSGGFTGVDVFFVISGFLIGRIVYSEVGEGSFSLLRFYERRARRILPALLATIAISWIVAGWLLLSVRDGRFFKICNRVDPVCGQSLFFGASGYFAPAAETIPLLHLWSLGVEEQFYPAISSDHRAPARYSPRLMFTALCRDVPIFAR